MRKNDTPKAELQPLSMSHYGGHFFANVLPCESCGQAANARYASEHSGGAGPDEYDLTLQEEAYRLTNHAKALITMGQFDNGAGMLRDAARLLDLLGQRQRARFDAEDAAKSRRRTAARR